MGISEDKFLKPGISSREKLLVSLKRYYELNIVTGMSSESPEKSREIVSAISEELS